MDVARPLPPLPSLNDVDLLLDVYTHKSLKFAEPPLNDDYGDTERLAELGARLVDLILTQHLFMHRPMLTAEEIVTRRDHVLTDEMLEHWLNCYQMKRKIRYNPHVMSLDNNYEVLRKFFYTYIGAVYYKSGGISDIQNWILALLNPDAKLPTENNTYSSANRTTSPPPPQANTSSNTWGYHPQPPNSPPPPMPPPPAANNDLPKINLALVNQTAAQKGYMVTYKSESTGPPHAPTWTVHCLINGVERGAGTGKNTKLAKEEAARQAWVNMGWGAYY